jgi:hypothetical protein
MTMRELERDLELLAQPREEDERVRRALRAQLGARLAPRPRRRLTTRIALGWTAASAAAAGIALVALVGTSGTGGPQIADAAIVHHALRAVSPPADRILHFKLVGVNAPAVVELWRETSPPYAVRAVKGEPGHLGEFADNGRTRFEYDPQTNTIREHADSASLRFSDPVAQVRRELASAQARVVGRVTIDGAALYKIDLPHGLIGYFDVRSYRPRYLDDPQRGGGVVRLRVVAYQFLAMTPVNRALLSITAQHPGARLVTGAIGGAGK